MSSLFETVKRIILGQPLFDEPKAPAQNIQSINAGQPTGGPVPSPAETNSSPIINKGNPQTFPIVRITRIETEYEGEAMKVFADLHNEFEAPILLYKLQLFGTNRMLTGEILPGNELQAIIYEGPVFHQKPADDIVKLDYKTTQGDFFEAIHNVTYMYHEQTNTYTFDQMNLCLPVEDIYG